MISKEVQHYEELPNQYGRQVIKCSECGLVQFKPEGVCRRCKNPLLTLDKEEAEKEELQSFAYKPYVPVKGIDFAGAVRLIRLALELSQSQLAGRMQLNRSYVSKIENTNQMPKLSQVPRFAAALEVPPAVLVQFAQELTRQV